MRCRQCSSNPSSQIAKEFFILMHIETRYLERKLGGRRISVGTVKRSSLMDLLDAGLVIEEQVRTFTLRNEARRLCDKFIKKEEKTEEKETFVLLGLR